MEETLPRTISVASDTEREAEANLRTEKDANSEEGEKERVVSAWIYTKSLADVYDSLTAVTLISSGYDFHAVWEVIEEDVASCAACVKRLLAAVGRA
ncbi:ribonuclease type III Dicer [Besnoitia besnoiti]|uniref:Ribonuclease type III Dicer n=1 Tax=Besnoitia besnoiti TaxID=94643 RepID=A0A2A9MHX3_BESBE|nr:ribonuclease type III Dicer [Besnoitia besnoiti]PFH36794.1 ribonuclease type III Dicer [Besnoitia besnoiti]